MKPQGCHTDELFPSTQLSFCFMRVYCGLVILSANNKNSISWLVLMHMWLVCLFIKMTEVSQSWPLCLYFPDLQCHLKADDRNGKTQNQRVMVYDFFPFFSCYLLLPSMLTYCFFSQTSKQRMRWGTMQVFFFSTDVSDLLELELGASYPLRSEL